MAVAELFRIAEIDRSEHITQQYKARLGTLELIDVDIHAPGWGEPTGEAHRSIVSDVRDRLGR